MTRQEEIEKGIEYFRKNKNRLASLYLEMYGEAICVTCKGSFKYAYERIVRDKDKEFTTYRMKRGCVINTTMRTEEDLPKGRFTYNNMTNEIAEKLIKYGYSSYFIL